MFLLDTNVVSGLRRPANAPAALTAWAAGVPLADQFLSAISVFELELGVRQAERRDTTQGKVLRRWLSEQIIPRFKDRILPLDEMVATKCAALHVPDPRPYRDSFIAATALAHRLVVVTRNTKDFPDVETVNPWLET